MIPLDDQALWLPSVGELVDATASHEQRRGCSAHHTATHMLAAALRAVLPSEAAAERTSPGPTTTQSPAASNACPGVSDAGTHSGTSQYSHLQKRAMHALMS